MKIAFFINSLKNSAGTERISTVIANSLVRNHGMEVDMITIHGCKPFFELDGRIGLKHLVPHKTRSKIFRHYAGYVSRLRGLLREGGYDYVVDVDIQMSLFSLAAAAGLKTKVISWEQFNANVNWRSWTYPLARRLATLLSYRVVVLTDADKALYRQKFGARNVVRIYNPVTIDAGGPSQLRENRFLALGRLHRQKGFDMLLDAWAAADCRQEGWTLRIVGAGKWKDKLGAQIDRLGLADSVEMLPQTSDVVRMFSEASCFVLSSRYEGFGLVLLEAAAMGLPAVSFDCELGPGEIIVDGVTGRLVPPGDVRALAAAMDAMAADPEARVRMGAAALEHSRLFSLDAITAQWVDLLKGSASSQ